PDHGRRGGQPGLDRRSSPAADGAKGRSRGAGEDLDRRGGSGGTGGLGGLHFLTPGTLRPSSRATDRALPIAYARSVLMNPPDLWWTRCLMRGSGTSPILPPAAMIWDQKCQSSQYRNASSGSNRTPNSRALM